jgi:DNA-binding LacI/PurR family transcriptional regulator
VADVARLAGVSPSSVSRVLNNVRPISDRTRRRVELAVEELGYRHKPITPAFPNPLAVIVPDVSNPYFLELADGVEEGALSAGMMVNLVISGRAPDPKQIERWLVRAGYSGLVLTSSTKTIPDELLISLREKEGIPIVLINRRIESPQIPSLTINFEDASCRAARHLIRLHHRRIAVLAGPQASESSRRKRLGIERAFAEAGIVDDPQLWQPGPPTVEWGYQNMTHILRTAAPRPTAVLAFNDLVALGAMHAIRSAGMEIPRDVSVIGFDDIAMAAHANPPLTTVSPPKRDMGKLAVALLDQIRQSGPPVIDNYTVMESPLVERETTAAVRTAGNG